MRNRDTRPEHHVRKLLHHNGFRFRLYPADLPGKPDIWMAKWRTAIFIHGCFWHMHDCDKFRLPATRTAFWQKNYQRIKSAMKIYRRTAPHGVTHINHLGMCPDRENKII
uniref:hypothetical protein n=1 Tax=Morganella morganii TaxID=582 RepID=UPI001FFC3475|nr:hypothetical protein [Morganella morganii]